MPVPEFGGHAELRTQEISGLETPYELRPDNGVVRAGQPVDVVLKDYPDVSIRLSLTKLRADPVPVLEVAPTVQLGSHIKVALTREWLKRTLLNLNMKVGSLSEQRSDAKANVQELETWLASPSKKAAVRRRREGAPISVEKSNDS